MKAPTLIRTNDVLEHVRRDPTRARDVALALGVPTRARDVALALGVPTRRIPGHLAWLVRCGLIERTRVRGYYVRTPRGDQHLATVRLPGEVAA